VSPSAARWFALGTGTLALFAVCVAVLMGARLHKTRSALIQLKQHEGCISAPALTPTTKP
jgi:NAD/NADP transhydrogenase alpha subunit